MEGQHTFFNEKLNQQDRMQSKHIHQHRQIKVEKNQQIGLHTYMENKSVTKSVCINYETHHRL